LIINIAFIVLRLFLRRSLSSWTLYILYLLSFALAGFIQFQLESFGHPTFDENGGVIKSGEDLGQAGLTEYMFDILYLTWGIQILVAVTTIHAFWLYLLVNSEIARANLQIPGYAAFKLWGLYSASQGTEATATTQESRNRSQKRATRR
jgi:SRP-independent targeting protein 2/TMEM208